MSLDTVPSAAHSPTTHQPKRIGTKVKRACGVMIQEGLPWQQAADKAGLSKQHFWLALQQAHVINYIRQQRQVFRASLVDEATFRVRELSRQDDNKAAAFSAASRLMSEQDEQVSRGSQHSSPGLVVIIQGPVQAKVIEHDPTETST